MSKRINPHHRPCTQADVDKAREEGKTEGMEFMLTIILWTLVDKHGAPDEDLQVLSSDIAYIADSINRKYVSYADIKRALKEEHGLDIEMK